MSARPRFFLLLTFATIWVLAAISLHYIPQPYGNEARDIRYGWGDAVGIAFILAAVGTSLTFLYHRQSE